MYQAIPYGRGMPGDPPTYNGPSSSSSSSSYSTSTTASVGGEAIGRLVAENPVVVVGRRGCCMAHVVKRLLHGLGVNPAICEVGEAADEAAFMEELTGGETDSLRGNVATFPAVFIGGRLVGGIDRLMAMHISGDLVPALKGAGALWL